MEKWSIGVREVGASEWDVQPVRYASREVADAAVVEMVVAAAHSGVSLESAVFCDGVLDHEHGAPRRVLTW